MYPQIFSPQTTVRWLWLLLGFCSFANCLPVRAVDSTAAFNEVMYHPATPAGAEWIELHNQMAVNLDLSRWRITGGVNFTFPEGTTLTAGGYLVVSGSPTLPGSLGPWTGRLDNSGESIQLKNVSGRTMDRLSWTDSGRWPVGADGSGASLSKRLPGSGGGEPEGWTASWQTGGTPAVRNFPEGLLLGPAQSQIAQGSSWIYLQGVDLGENWEQTAYTAETGGWKAGRGAFSFDETPPPDGVGTFLADPAGTTHPVCYFQKSFTFSGVPAQTQWSARILIDDGAVVYLNGHEIARRNMPDGAVTGATRATASIGNALPLTLPLPGQFLVVGTNLLSVSLHDGPLDSAPPLGLSRVEEGGTMDPTSNLALTSRSAVAFAKDLLPGYAPTHTIPNLNNGTSGNPSSWIGNSSNSFCGINLGAIPVPLSGIAFGRDNTGTFTDRTSGTYTIQYTTVPNPSASTPAASWITIGTLVYGAASPPLFTKPSLRHRYDFPTISATGIRLLCSANGICVDELELYGPRLPDLVFDLALNSQEILPLPGDTRIVFNEIAGTHDPIFRVELKNEGTTAVNLAGMMLNGFTLPAQQLAPSAFVVFEQAQLGFRPADGQRLFLYTAGGGTLLDAAIAHPVGRARYQGHLLTPSAATFGAENAFALGQDIVINEIMYHFPPRPSVPAVPPVPTNSVLLPLDATWRYHAANTDLGFNWAQSIHPEAVGNWQSGQALLGFSPTPTALPDTLRTPFVSSLATTCYFETEFNLTAEQLATLGELRLEHVIDDGAAFFINGTELKSLRLALPGGPNLFSTPATLSVGNAVLSTPKFIPLAGLNLQAGPNRLSVEVHNQTPAGTDLIFGARLSAVTYLVPPQPARPVTSDPEEWVELHHYGATARPLDGWKLQGAVDFTFPPGTAMAPGGFLVVARDAAALKAKWPEMADKIIGNFSGSLSNSGGRIRLEDALENPADEVDYLAGGWADGGGSSLELRDPRSDNSSPSAWADSDESAKSSWQTFSYRMTATQKFGPATWNEIRLGMLDAGECLIDDLSVRANPDGAATEVMQNGNFEALPAGSKWRLLGNHRTSNVMEEPGNPTNHVLRLNASGPTETNHNHAESTFVNNRVLAGSTTHEVSFRARWLAGTNQLNTRAYYQKLARAHDLPIPVRLGTPGKVNSRHLANAGPILTSLTHAPPVPSPGSPVTVSFAAVDPDGVVSASLHFRLNGATTFTTAAMTLGTGLWSASIPSQAAGAMVHFYVEATDSTGASSFGPGKGSDSRALIQWADTQGSPLAAHQLRLIMLSADRDFLLAPLNRLSNERIPGTLVYRGAEVFYDAGVRLQGTAAGRVRDGEDYVGYDIGFPAGQLFRGVHESVGIDRSGRAPVVRQQDEIYVRQTFQRAGIPCPVDDLCHFIAPQPIHTGTAILQLASYGGLWAGSQFDEQGTVFNYDVTYDPTSTSVSGNPESLKPAVPFIHVTTDLVDLGDDKEQYRGPFDIRAGKRRDDYTALMKLCKTMALDNTQLALQAPQVLDLDEVLRCTALVNLWGIADTYFTGGFPHNIRLFTPDDATGINFLPWDMDFVMSGATSSAIIPTGNNLGKLISNVPGNRRRYLGHVRHLCATVFKSSYLTPWLSHYGTVVGQNFSGAAAYVNARSTFAATQYPAAAVYAITTNGGADFSVAASQTLLEGTGWIDIHEIRRAGSQDPLDLTWIGNTQWRAALPLVSGPNPIALEAYDFEGALMATRTITVTNTLSEPNPRDFLRITELHYHPAGPATAAELAASSSPSDFEFIELKNLSPQPLKLNGVHAAAGVDFRFPEGTFLSGGQFAVLARNRTAFQSRYGTGITILGEYLTDSLSNNGETVTLLDSTGAAIQSFTFSDAWFPHTDGPGWSMVAADELAPAANLNLPASWAISAQKHGNPGAPNGAIFSTEFEGWRHQQFTEAELSDPLISGPAAAPGGLPNLLRYALALSRLHSASPGTGITVPTAGQLQFSYRRPKLPLDLQYTPESSLNLKAWLANSTPFSRTDHGNGTETVEVRFTAEPPTYLRLKVTLVP